MPQAYCHVQTEALDIELFGLRTWQAMPQNNSKLTQ